MSSCCSQRVRQCSSANVRLGKDKRDHTRVAVSLTVNMLTPKGPIEGVVKNISPDGALIVLPEIPNLNEILRLAIDIPDYEYAVLVSAKIVRLEIYNMDSSTPPYGLGVRFVEISEEDFGFLCNTILR